MSDGFYFSRHQCRIKYDQAGKKPMLSWPRNNYAVQFWGKMSQAKRNHFNDINPVMNYSAFPIFYIAFRRKVENLFFADLLADGLITQAEFLYLTTEPPRAKL